MPLESALTTIANRLDNDVEEVLREAAAEVVRLAKANVPVQTGDLQKAIHADRVGTAEYRVIAGDAEAWYGHIVEGGGVGLGRGGAGGTVPPRPFLVPAFELARTRFDDRVKAEFQKWPSVERARRVSR